MKRDTLPLRFALLDSGSQVEPTVTQAESEVRLEMEGFHIKMNLICVGLGLVGGRSYGSPNRPGIHECVIRIFFLSGLAPCSAGWDSHSSWQAQP